MGHLFHRRRRDRNGKVREYKTWTYKFYHNNKQRYYNTGETNKRKAKDKALAYEAEVKKGDTPWEYDKTTFEDMKEMLELDYKTNRKKSTERMIYSLKALESYFSGYKAKNITTHQIRLYIKQRQDAEKANATINRELAALKRMFHLAEQETPPRVAQVPHIPMLKEDNVREGFFEYREFEALRTKAPFYLKGVITLAYETGMRKEEILSLTWDQIDLQGKTIRLTDTKSGEARTIPFSTIMSKVFRNYMLGWGRKKLSENELKSLPYVFLNRDGNDRIRDFRAAWDTACEKAGIGKKLFHDLRRTAVRNMVRSGVSEHTAMKISGHKTRSIFDRYDIISDKDIKEAAGKVEDYLNGQKEALIERRDKVVPLKGRGKSEGKKAEKAIKTT